MTTTALTSRYPTMIDVVQSVGPDGKELITAELLAETNEIIQDAVVKASNQPTSEVVSIRTGLPDVYYRQLGSGVPSSKSTRAKVTEGMAMMEAWSKIDAAELQLNGNDKAFRLSEDVAFLEAMNQKCAYTMFYGNAGIDTKEFTGLATRYSSTSAGNGGNILLAGGSDASHNTSVYLIGWGLNTVYMPYPKHMTAGLKVDDKGIQTLPDDSGYMLDQYVTKYEWQHGLVVKDWRYGVRIANLYTTDLLAQSSTQAASATTALMKLMTRALEMIPSMGACRPVFYCNRTVHAGLMLAALEKSSSALRIEEAVSQFGTPRMWGSFLGVPFRKVDEILNTESVVS